MDETTNLITNLLSIGTVVLDFLLVYLVVIIALKENVPAYFGNLIKKYWLYYCFILSTGATIASFYYSDIAKFPPCTFCWYQRIFMIPLVFIFGLAIYRKEIYVRPYAKLMCAIGTLIAIYHYSLQIGITSISPCSAVSGGIVATCVDRPFVTFGYITIPIMSLSTFLFIYLILKLSDEKPKQ